MTTTTRAPDDGALTEEAAALLRRGETFGYDDGSAWAEPALRLLFNAPRVYEPLAATWDRWFPSTRTALERLARVGFVAYQPPVVVNTRTAELADASSSPVARYVATARGRRLVAAAAEDLRVLEDTFPRASPRNVDAVAALLAAFCLDGGHARYGLSVAAANDDAGLPDRTARWWVRRLVAGGWLRRLDTRIPDTRPLVPAHWRPTRPLARQLRAVLDAFPDAPSRLSAELRLSRTRFLGPIDPARVGVSGATDYDHDVRAQRVVADLLRSPSAAPDGVFVVEPRLALPARRDGEVRRFVRDGDEVAFYQPDAELRERRGRRVRRVVCEYEATQSRRDAWGHIERFCGWLALTALPGEEATLRFVVDSDQRVRSYVALIEAYADWALDHPSARPPVPAELAVSSVSAVAAAADPLSSSSWYRVDLPAGDAGEPPVLHPAERSPYDDYFSRAPADAAAAADVTYGDVDESEEVGADGV